jgi:1-acyl-sn-glycerol-3-phosphate acyltransferase
MKTDIVPVGIIGCEHSTWIPFAGKIKITIGESISHEKEVDEILDEWAQKISQLTNYEIVENEKEEITN